MFQDKFLEGCTFFFFFAASNIFEGTKSVLGGREGGREEEEEWEGWEEINECLFQYFFAGLIWTKFWR